MWFFPLYQLPIIQCDRIRQVCLLDNSFSCFLKSLESVARPVCRQVATHQVVATSIAWPGSQYGTSCTCHTGNMADREHMAFLHRCILSSSVDLTILQSRTTFPPAAWNDCASFSTHSGDRHTLYYKILMFNLKLISVWIHKVCLYQRRREITELYDHYHHWYM